MEAQARDDDIAAGNEHARALDHRRQLRDPSSPVARQRALGGRPEDSRGTSAPNPGSMRRRRQGSRRGEDGYLDAADAPDSGTIMLGSYNTAMRERARKAGRPIPRSANAEPGLTEHLNENDARREARAKAALDVRHDILHDGRRLQTLSSKSEAERVLKTLDRARFGNAELTIRPEQKGKKPAPRDRVLAAGTSVLAPGMSMPVGC